MHNNNCALRRIDGLWLVANQLWSAARLRQVQTTKNNSNKTKQYATNDQCYFHFCPKGFALTIFKIFVYITVVIELKSFCVSFFSVL